MRTLYIWLFLIFLALFGLLIAQGLTAVRPEFILYLTAGAFLGFFTFLNPSVGIYLMLLSCLFFPEVPLGMAKTGMTTAQREVGIRPDDLMIVLIGVGWFTRLAIQRRLLLIPQTPVNTPIIILSFIMILATVLGVATGSTTLKGGLFFTLKKVEYFLVFFMVITNLTTEREVKIGVAVLLISAGIVAIWGIIEHRMLPEIRVSGPFQRSQGNVLGGYMLIIGFLGLTFLVNYYRATGLRFWLIILLVLCLYTVAFTRSRSSYTSFFIGMIVFSILTRRYYLLVIPLILIGLVGYLFTPRETEAVRSILGVFRWRGVENPSWESRVNNWMVDAVPKITKRPLLGYGLGSHDLAWADNQYVLDALSMGLIGLGVFIWLLARLFITAWQMYGSRGPPDRTVVRTSNIYPQTLGLGFLACLSAVVIQGIAIANFYTIRTMVPFWFLAGLVMVARNIEMEKASAKTIEST